MSGLAADAAALLGGVLQTAEPLQGGDLSQCLRVTLSDGRTAVAKTGPCPPAEARMLRAIAATGAPAPSVLGVTDTALVLEYAEAGGALDAAWPSLGHALATLHGATGPSYGWPAPYAFGAVTIDNTPHPDWPAFWAGRRLLSHVPHVAPEIARRLERLAAALGDILPRHPRAALLHGDLWGGNILVSDGAVTAFIDPACSYGHAEADLAMLRLFDHPGPAFTDAYGPAEPGHAARLPIYQLWPALVHLRLFGQAYRGLVERLLTAAGV